MTRKRWREANEGKGMGLEAHVEERKKKMETKKMTGRKKRTREGEDALKVRRGF